MEFRDVKAQSAMEFLSTYGWMMLIIAIIAVGLFYLVTSSSLNSGGPKALPGSCQVFRPDGPGSAFQVSLQGVCTGQEPEFAASFNPSTSSASYITVPANVLTPNRQSNAITISLWVNPSLLSGMQSLIGASQGASLYLNGNKVCFNVAPSTNVICSATILQGSWSYITFVSDGRNGNIYINGNLMSTSSVFESKSGIATNPSLGFLICSTCTATSTTAFTTSTTGFTTVYTSSPSSTSLSSSSTTSTQTTSVCPSGPGTCWCTQGVDCGTSTTVTSTTAYTTLSTTTTVLPCTLSICTSAPTSSTGTTTSVTASTTAGTSTLISSTTSITAPPPPANVGGIGYCSCVVQSQPFNGLISDVQVYNASLSSNDIQSMYIDGIGSAPLNLQSLVAWYPLNGNPTDYSGNKNVGAETNILYTNAWTSGYTPP